MAAPWSGFATAPAHPPEPFCVPLSGGEARLLARLSGFDPALFEQLARLESFEVAATDGGSVHSFLLTPRSAGPHPLLLWVHGGPMNPWADGWHWRWNPLLGSDESHVVTDQQLPPAGPARRPGADPRVLPRWRWNHMPTCSPFARP
ncbi:MAG TPA: hypothetical protein VFS67_25085 [Polyangiaceae bacterium]|jgi:dipeptidyl aminopeptidase/acylaminoacyl peptidase|nr:hypothetical protein [Polyangiaceae bacterium]